MTGVVDEKGTRFETTTYDAQGLARSSSFAGGVDKFMMAPGSTVTVTTPLGASSTLNFTTVLGAYRLATSSNACGEACNQPFKARTFDANGYPASFTDRAGTVTQTSYDANGLLTRQVEASGKESQRATSTTWDIAHRVPLTRAVSNASGIVVEKSVWTYNARGQVTAECTVDPSVTASYTCGSQAHAPQGIRQRRYTYCEAVDSVQCPQIGLLLSVDGPRTDVTDTTRFAYYLSTDESGCAVVGGTCHRAGDLAQETDAAGLVSSILSYDRNGRLTRQKDPNGVITDISYTPRGWLASHAVRANSNGSPSTADAITLTTYESTGTVKTMTDPDGVIVTYSYDDAHRLVDVADVEKNHIHYTLDASGNRLKDETFDAAGSSRRSLSRKYNALGQMVSATDGLGHIVFDATASGSYDANGNLVQSKDPLGIVRKDTYDALSRVVASAANAGGADAATRDTTISKVFDALDQAKSITDPDGLVTTYGYDGLSNPTTLTSPDTGTSRATFNVAGNALTRTDAKGTVATNAYDALGRMISTSYPDATLNVAYHFDEADSITGCQGSFPIGRLTRIVETAVTTVYCYDNQGRVSEQRQTQGTVTDTTDYVYTLAGRLAGIASPSGLVTAYSRDALGQITSVTVTPLNGTTTNVVTGASYLPFGPIARYTLGNGQTLTRTYDANYQVTDVVSPALALHFARDAAGNIKALGDTPGASPATETYTYDSLDRLLGVTDASGHSVEAYTYSRTGDRLSKAASGFATGDYVYKAGTHWLTSVGAASRSYDTNGASTGGNTAGMDWEYGYNSRKELTVLKQGVEEVASYAYNVFGSRVAKAAGGSLQRFSYGLSGQLLGEYGTSARDYVWLAGLPVGLIDSSASAMRLNFVHADGLGAPRAVTSSSGTSIWTWAFRSNPFGEAAPKSTAGYTLNLRFPGQYFDAESGLLQNVHRFYDPGTGRYLQSDPTGLAGGVSTYAYVAGNPLTYVDPTGLDAVILVNEGTVPISANRNAGHIGVAIGNDQAGWSFFQEGGYDAAGRQQTTAWKFSTWNDLESAYSGYLNGIGAPMTMAQAFTYQQGIHTMPLQDMLMKTWAQEHLNDRYSGYSNNCGDFVLGVLRNGGLHPTGDGFKPTVPNWISIGSGDDPDMFTPQKY